MYLGSWGIGTTYQNEEFCKLSLITRCGRIQDGDGWDEPDAETGSVKAVDDTPHLPPLSRPVAGIFIQLLDTLEIVVTI